MGGRAAGTGPARRRRASQSRADSARVERPADGPSADRRRRVGGRHVPGVEGTMDLTATIDRAPLAVGAADRTEARTDGWDALLLCVAAYVLTAVGRIHQLFSALEVLHLAALAGVLAVALYVIDRSPGRRAAMVKGPTSTLVALLLV